MYIDGWNWSALREGIETKLEDNGLNVSAEQPEYKRNEQSFKDRSTAAEGLYNVPHLGSEPSLQSNMEWESIAREFGCTQ